MKRGIILTVCSIVFILCAGNAPAQEQSAGEKPAFITDFTAKLSYVERQVALARWEYLTTGRADSLDIYIDWYDALVGNPKNPDSIAQLISREKDRRVKRQLELLRRQTLRPAVDNTPEVRQYLRLHRDALIDGPLQFEGKATTSDELLATLTTTSNRSRRQAIYEGLVGPATARAEIITELARLRNQAAAELGYTSFYDLLLEANGIDKELLENLVSEVDELTAEPYQAIVDSLQRALNVNRLSAWDIDFAFRRATNQAAGYFRAENHLGLAKETLNGLGIKLDALPIYFAPVAEAVDFNGPELITVAIPHDFRIPLGQRGGGEMFNRFMAVIFEALYGYNMDDAEYMYLRPPAPCMNDALYWLVTDLVENDGWNRKYAGMPEPLVILLRTKHRFERLYRVRKALAMIELEGALYKDPLADLNTRYAAIEDKYMGVVDVANVFPWAVDPGLINNPGKSANALVGFVIGAQISNYLTEKYGTILDNQRTREFLVQNIFRFGAREKWQLLVERATGEMISPKYIVSALR